MIRFCRCKDSPLHHSLLPPHQPQSTSNSHPRYYYYSVVLHLKTSHWVYFIQVPNPSSFSLCILRQEKMNTSSALILIFEAFRGKQNVVKQGKFSPVFPLADNRAGTSVHIGLQAVWADSFTVEQKEHILCQQPGYGLQWLILKYSSSVLGSSELVIRFNTVKWNYTRLSLQRKHLQKLIQSLLC